MEFIRLTPERLEDIKVLFREVFTGEPWNDDWSDDHQLTMYITELVCPENSLTFAMEENGRLIALSMGRIRHWFSGAEYYIDELCVRTDLQGRGIGSLFTESIENALREMGIHHIFLQTGRNMPAYGFYQRRGFTELKDQVSFIKNI